MDRSRDTYHGKSGNRLRPINPCPYYRRIPASIRSQRDFDRNITGITLHASTVAGAIIFGVSVSARDKRLIQPSNAQAG